MTPSFPRDGVSGKPGGIQGALYSPGRRRSPRRAHPGRGLARGGSPVSADPAQVLRVVPAGGDDVERRYAADDWRAGELGVPAARGRTAVSFTGIGQSWLREAAKRWARQRLSIGCAFNTICAGAVALKRFSRFLAAGEPPTARPEDIDRALLERYLGYLAPLPLAASTT